MSIRWFSRVGIEAGIARHVFHGERRETVGPISPSHPSDKAHPPAMDPTGKPWGAWGAPRKEEGNAGCFFRSAESIHSGRYLSLAA